MKRRQQAAEKPILTSAEVAALFSVTTKSVNLWARDGKLRGFRTVGPHGHWRFYRKDILPLLSFQQDQVPR